MARVIAAIPRATGHTSCANPLAALSQAHEPSSSSPCSACLHSFHRVLASAMAAVSFAVSLPHLVPTTAEPQNDTMPMSSPFPQHHFPQDPMSRPGFCCAPAGRHCPLELIAALFHVAPHRLSLSPIPLCSAAYPSVTPYQQPSPSSELTAPSSGAPQQHPFFSRIGWTARSSDGVNSRPTASWLRRLSSEASFHFFHSPCRHTFP
jgi:hypothetical protein